MNYDLEERTAKFGEDIIDFIKSLERNEMNKPLISQPIRSLKVAINNFKIKNLVIIFSPRLMGLRLKKLKN